MSGLIQVSGSGNVIRGVINGDLASGWDAGIEFGPTFGSANVIDGMYIALSNTTDHGIIIPVDGGDFIIDNRIGTVEIAGTVDIPIEDLNKNTQYPGGGAVAFADPSDPLTVVTGDQPYPWMLGDRCQIIDVRAVVDIAPTGADLILDVLNDGASFWATTPANRLTIPAGSKDSGRFVPDENAWPIFNGDIFTIDIAQVGSTIAGSRLTLVMRYMLL